MKTYQDLLDEVRARVRETSVTDAASLAKASDTVFLDVREAQEYNVGRIPGAVTISRGTLESDVEARVPRQKRVIVYCSSGNRSVFAADVLADMGYPSVSSLAGGFRGWVSEGGDVE
jgi:rhodanese-related sulfurtransferase